MIIVVVNCLHIYRVEAHLFLYDKVPIECYVVRSLGNITVFNQNQFKVSKSLTLISSTPFHWLMSMASLLYMNQERYLSHSNQTGMVLFWRNKPPNNMRGIRKVGPMARAMLTFGAAQEIM